ncbi:acyl carrier protein [Micromonospora sp. NPDC050417]|uniref:acyl carrier protein n=1 Tax=Micromonospora sp. NPDC050417 TaxID=3364280 RepID=UPI0037A64C30
MSDVYEQIVKVLSERFFVDVEVITPDSTVRDLDLDSLASVEMADVLEGVIGTSVDESAIADRTLREIAEMLTAQLESANG